MRFIILSFLFTFHLNCKENYEVPNHAPGVIKVIDDLLITAYGEGGLVISDERTGELIAQIFPPREMQSIDDFDVDGNLIFALDSRGRGYMAVFSLSGNDVNLVSPPIQVQGGPFNGISAANGNLVVSGGTTFLNRFIYNSAGEISGPINFGRDRGHPDVLLSEDGQYAFISTDFGIGLDIDRFGIMSLFIGNKLQIPSVISELGISEAGFTKGVTTPVGFPIQSVIYQDHLFVAHGGGISAIELIAGGAFGNSTTWATNISGITTAVDGNRVYLVGYQADIPVLITIDISDLNNPIIVSQITLDIGENIPTSIAVGTDEIFIAAGSSGILFFEKN